MGASELKKSLYDLRARLAIDLVTDHGLTLAESARQLGVSTSAVSKLFIRKGKVNRN